MEPKTEIQLLTDIEREIFSAAGGRSKFLSELPYIFRQAVDELIDAPRTRRLTFAELEPNEKTVLGTKVEAALRYLLGFPRAKLDFFIGGHDVDVKYSSTGQWMIPPEAKGHVCIVAQADETTGLFSFGLVAALTDRLRTGSNRDAKVSFLAEARKHIRWIAHSQPYPRNIWEGKSQSDINFIFEPNDGTGRICRLFLSHVGEPIHRYTIQTVARQHDYMKRVRANQGARDHLHPQGVFILSGNQDGPLLRQLGLGYLGRDFMMAYRPRSSAEAELIMKKPRHAKLFKFRG